MGCAGVSGSDDIGGRADEYRQAAARLTGEIRSGHKGRREMQHVFQSFWLGPQISPYQLLSMQSFVSHGHRYILYCYDRMPVVPGVELRDAADILPRSRVFFTSEDPARGASPRLPTCSGTSCCATAAAGGRIPTSYVSGANCRMPNW